MSEYTFDLAWETLIRILPKYMNSHFYDIIAYSCGLAGFFVAFILRRGIKRRNRRRIEKKYSYDLYHHDPIRLKPILFYRMRNLFIPLWGMIISELCFAFVAMISKTIVLNTVWLRIVPFVSVGFYCFFELLGSGIVGCVFTFAITYFVFKRNYDYCYQFEDHHKICYAVRTAVVVFGVIGLVKQFLPPFDILFEMMKEKIKSAREKKLNRGKSG